jgi:hypothetical protein
MGPGMSEPIRHRLPHRRPAIAFDFRHGELSYRAHVGFFEDGRVGELFLNASKQNSALDAFAADAAILISLLLQRGSTVAEIGHALRHTPHGAPASLIGAVIDQLAQLLAEIARRP